QLPIPSKRTGKWRPETEIQDSLLFGLSRFRFLPRNRFLAYALRQDGVHLIAFLPRRRLGDRDVGQILDQPLENPSSDLRVRHLASAEENRGLDLVAVSQEALDVLLLELIIVLVHLGTELNLLDLDDLLVLLGLSGALLFLVLVASEVHDAANRRRRRGRNFDQVKSLLLGNNERLLRRHDSQL